MTSSAMSSSTTSTDVEVGEADISGSDAVRVMTIHAAKGLEFPVVFLAQVKPVLERHDGWLFFDDEFGLIMKNLGGDDPEETASTRSGSRRARAGCPSTSSSPRRAGSSTWRSRAPKRKLVVSATRRKDPTWDAVLSDARREGKGAYQTELDHFRTMALFVRNGGVGTLLERRTWPARSVPPPRPPVAHDRHTSRRGAATRRHLGDTRAQRRAAVARPVVSFSQLEVLAQCGLRYQYMFEWRLPAPPDDLWPSASPATTQLSALPTSAPSCMQVLEQFHQPGPTDGTGGIERLHQLWREIAGAARMQSRGHDVGDHGPPDVRALPQLHVAAMTTIATEQEVNLAVEVRADPS